MGSGQAYKIDPAQTLAHGISSLGILLSGVILAAPGALFDGSHSPPACAALHAAGSSHDPKRSIAPRFWHLAVSGM